MPVYMLDYNFHLYGYVSTFSILAIIVSSINMANKLSRKIFKSIMRSYRFNLPNHDLPIRLRPVSDPFGKCSLLVLTAILHKWFLCGTVIIMLILAFLGFTNYSHALPLNDKLLHFICLCLATGVFYFIFDVEEYVQQMACYPWR